MTTSLDSQNFESFVPVYDTVPPKWDDARPFLVEQLKSLGIAINIREIGWYLDVELLSGGLFVPSVIDVYQTQPQYRTIFRKVIVFGPIVMGLNTMPHGIIFDGNFSLVHLWASATQNIGSFRAVTFSNSDTINMDSTNINITSDQAYNLCYAFVEYLLEP
jgi:hypothetical protein